MAGSVLSLGTLFAHLGIDTAQFTRGITAAQRDLDLTATAARRTGASVDTTAAALAGAGRQADVASAGSAKLRAAQLSLVAAQERYNALIAQDEVATGKLASAQASLIRANERVRASAPPYATMAPQMASAATATSTLASRTSSAAVSVGKMALGFAAFGAVFKAAEMVHQANEFQRSMLLIETQAGATRAELQAMTKSVLGLSGQVATSPEQLATSLYHIESVGLRGAKALDVLKIAAQGAKVGNADLEETTNALTSTVASGIKGVENMQQAMGALNTIVGSGDMKLSDLNGALGGGILAAAKGFGVSLTEVGAVLATFGDNNIRGADAATGLRMAIMAMAKPAREGKDALASIGLTVDTLKTDMQQGGLTLAVDDLDKHMKAAGVTGEKVGGFITDAFGKKAGVGLNVLMGQVDRFHTKIDEITRGSGSFASRWSETTKTAAFGFEKLRASTESAAISLYSSVGPAAGNVAAWVGTTLPSAIGRLQNVLGPLEHEVGVGLVMAWQGLSVVLRTAGAALSGITNFLNRHRAIVTGVGTAVGGMWLAYKGYQIAKFAVQAVSDALAALRLRALNAGLSMKTATANASAMGMISGFALGGIGVALGIASVLWQRHAQAVAQAKQEVQSLTDAIKEDNGAIGDNTKAGVANLLWQQGAFTAAQKLGISATDLFNAVMLQGDAIDRVNGALAVYQRNSKGVAADADPLYSSYQKVIDALTGTSGKLHDAVSGYKTLDSVLGDNTAAQTAAKVTIDGTTVALKGQVDAATALSQALDTLSGNAISAQQAELGFKDLLAQGPSGKKAGAPTEASITSAQGSAASATERYKRALEAVTVAQERYNLAVERNNRLHTSTSATAVHAAELSLARAHDAVTTAENAQTVAGERLSSVNSKIAEAQKSATATLDENTDAGRKNREWLLNLVQSANQHANAVMKQTNNVDLATDALRKDEAQILDAAHAQGIYGKALQDVLAQTEATPGDLLALMRSQTVAATKATTKLVDAYAHLSNQARKNITMRVDIDGSAAVNELRFLQAQALQLQNLLSKHAEAADNGSTALIPKHAGGGNLDAGWNLVGERGAELVNRETGRVLTAQQTHAAGMGGGSVHIGKIEQTFVNPLPEPVSKSSPAGVRRALIAAGY